MVTVFNKEQLCFVEIMPQLNWQVHISPRRRSFKAIFFSDAGGQSRGFSIYNGFSNSTGQVLLDKNTAKTGHHFTISLNPHVALQHLEVSKSDVLTICELKLEEDGEWWSAAVLNDIWSSWYTFLCGFAHCKLSVDAICFPHMIISGTCCIFSA